MNFNLIQALKRDYNINSSVLPGPGGGDISIEMRLSGVKKLLEKPPHFELPYNRTQFMEQVFQGDCEFKGGTYQDLQRNLAGHADMGEFYQAKRGLESSDIAKRVRYTFTDGRPKRVRTRSEHDGDWSYHNRWDIRPYDAAIRARPPIKTVDLVCDFSINSGANASSINKYGAVVWAIIELLETAGINTRVIWQNIADKCGSRRQTVHVTLKEPGEYLNPQALAGCLNTLFFRRALFGVFILGAELNSQEAPYGLGRAVECPPCEFKNGKLVVASSVVGLTEEVERELYKALGVTKQKSA